MQQQRIPFGAAQPQAAYKLWEFQTGEGIEDEDGRSGNSEPALRLYPILNLASSILPQNTRSASHSASSPASTSSRRTSKA